MMYRKSLLIWIILLTFGFASMPDIGLPKESKQTGKTEVVKKKKSGKKHIKRHVKRHRYNKKRKGSKNRHSGGKTKYTKKSKYSKNSKFSKRTKYSKKSKYSKRNRHSYKRTYAKRYSPSTNNGTVEYRNYKRNSEGENTQQDIEKIAPQKEIRKEPKKEGE